MKLLIVFSLLMGNILATDCNEIYSETKNLQTYVDGDVSPEVQSVYFTVAELENYKLGKSNMITAYFGEFERYITFVYAQEKRSYAELMEKVEEDFSHSAKGFTKDLKGELFKNGYQNLVELLKDCPVK